jgi:hypothetical protein
LIDIFLFLIAVLLPLEKVYAQKVKKYCSTPKKEKGRQKLPAFQEEPEKSWGGQG